MKELTLVVGNQCGLCNDAQIQIALAQEDIDFTVNEINITSDPALEAQYFMSIPVLLHNDVVVQEGQIDFVTILEYLKKI